MGACGRKGPTRRWMSPGVGEEPPHTHAPAHTQEPSPAACLEL